jgi:hypothetical protein
VEFYTLNAVRATQAYQAATPEQRQVAEANWAKLANRVGRAKFKDQWRPERISELMRDPDAKPPAWQRPGLAVTDALAGIADADTEQTVALADQDAGAAGAVMSGVADTVTNPRAIRAAWQAAQEGREIDMAGFRAAQPGHEGEADAVVQARQLTRQAQAGMPGPLPGVVKDTIGSAHGMAEAYSVAVPAAVATGPGGVIAGPATMMGYFSARGTGEAFADIVEQVPQLDRKVAAEIAVPIGTLYGMTEGIADALGFGSVMGKLATKLAVKDAVNATVVNYFLQAGGEVTEEGVQGALNQLAVELAKRAAGGNQAVLPIIERVVSRFGSDLMQSIPSIMLLTAGMAGAGHVLKKAGVDLAGDEDAPPPPKAPAGETAEYRALRLLHDQLLKQAQEAQRNAGQVPEAAEPVQPPGPIVAPGAGQSGADVQRPAPAGPEAGGAVVPPAAAPAEVVPPAAVPAPLPVPATLTEQAKTLRRRLKKPAAAGIAPAANTGAAVPPAGPGQPGAGGEIPGQAQAAPLPPAKPKRPSRLEVIDPRVDLVRSAVAKAGGIMRPVPVGQPLPGEARQNGFSEWHFRKNGGLTIEQVWRDHIVPLFPELEDQYYNDMYGGVARILKGTNRQAKGGSQPKVAKAREVQLGEKLPEGIVAELHEDGGIVLVAPDGIRARGPGAAVADGNVPTAMATDEELAAAQERLGAVFGDADLSGTKGRAMVNQRQQQADAERPAPPAAGEDAPFEDQFQAEQAPSAPMERVAAETGHKLLQQYAQSIIDLPSAPDWVKATARNVMAASRAGRIADTAAAKAGLERTLEAAGKQAAPTRAAPAGQQQDLFGGKGPGQGTLFQAEPNRVTPADVDAAAKRPDIDDLLMDWWDESQVVSDDLRSNGSRSKEYRDPPASLDDLSRAKQREFVQWLRERERASEPTDIRLQSGMPEAPPATPAKRAELRQARRLLEAKWAGLIRAGRLQILTPDQVPPETRAKARQLYTDVGLALAPGEEPIIGGATLWDDGDGKVLLVLNPQHTLGRTLQISSHEIIGHFGLRLALGEDKYRQFTQFVIQHGLRAELKQLSKDLYGATDVERGGEILARAAEQFGADTTTWKRVAAAVRMWLRQNMPWLGPIKFSESDIRALLSKGRAMAERIEQGGASRGTTLRGSNATVTAPGQPPQFTIEGFHGTPHTFAAEEGAPLGRFKKEKVGTGEGAAAYGWGVAYVAQAQDVAESYASQVKDTAKVDRINQRLSQLAEIMERESVPGAYRTFKTVAGEEAAREYDALIAEKLKPGNLYHVEVLAEPDEFLDWDDPLSEQPPAVRDAWYAAMERQQGYRPKLSSDISGAEAYNMMAGGASGMTQFSDEAQRASERLASAGIKGIRYADQGSRGRGSKLYKVDWNDKHTGANVTERSTGKTVASFQTFMQAESWVEDHAPPPTYNYVVFREEDIRVTGRNGETLTPTQAAAEQADAAPGTQFQVDRDDAKPFLPGAPVAPIPTVAAQDAAKPVPAKPPKPATPPLKRAAFPQELPVPSRTVTPTVAQTEAASQPAPAPIPAEDTGRPPNLPNAKPGLPESIRISPAWRRLVTSTLFGQSNADVLEAADTPMARELADAARLHVDYADNHKGRLVTFFKPLEGKPAKVADAGKAEWSNYWSVHEDLGTDAAQPIYDRASPLGKALIDGWKDMGEWTGRMNARFNLKVWSPSLNAYRKIGNLGRRFFLRQLRQEVRETIRNSGEHPAEYAKLQQDLMDQGRTVEQVNELLQAVKTEMSSTNDYYAPMEMARGEKLPASWYEYEFDKVVPAFIQRYSERLAQIRAFGQRLNQGAEQAEDLYDKAQKLAANDDTRSYIAGMQAQAYGWHLNTPGMKAVDDLIGFATLTMLTNPVVTARNVISGLAANEELGGAARSIAAAKDLKGLAGKLDTRQLGLLNANLLDVMVWSELDEPAQKLRKGLRRATKAGLRGAGYMAAEELNRSHGALVAMMLAADSFHAMRENPTGQMAKEFRALARRLHIDADALAAENMDWAEGELSRRYLRRFVKDAQGGYRYDQVPQWAGTATGKMLYQFGRWGLQKSRTTMIHVVLPFFHGLSEFANGRATAADMVPLARNMARTGAGIAATGLAYGALSHLLFGRDDPEAEWLEIMRRYRRGEISDAAMEAASKVTAMIVTSGQLGVLQQPLNAAKQFATYSRVRNPMQPPGLQVVTNMTDLAKAVLDQKALTRRDAFRALSNQAAGATNVVKAAQNYAAKFTDGWHAANLYRARTTIGNMRGDMSRFAKEAGLEMRRELPGSGGNWRKSEFTPFYADIEDLLLTGDAAGVRKLVREKVKDQPAAKREDFMRSVRASVLARRPVRVGMVQGDETRERFFRWAARNLDPADVKRYRELDRTYRTTAVRAGLLTP